MLPDLEKHDWICHEPDGQIRLGGATPKIVFPGSFNPLHEGHWQLAAIAAQRFSDVVHFELSIRNADKPDLSHAEVDQRRKQFSGRSPLLVTRAWDFQSKAKLFPNCTFVVGADTAVRILQVKYYQDSESQLRSALDSIRLQGGKFFVAGRVDRLGRFIATEHLAIPEGFEEMFIGLTEQDFRLDVSSSQIRQRI